MDIVKGRKYRIKSFAQTVLKNWWVNTETSHRVKATTTTFLPLNVAGDITVVPDHKIDIQDLQEALSSDNQTLRLERLSGLEYSLSQPVVTSFLAENFELTEETITEEWLTSNGFVKSGRVELDTLTPITLEAV